MAGPHLERLRTKKSHQGVVEAPSKPSKLGFEGFEGDRGRPFLETKCLIEAPDVAAKNKKNATPAHPQNLQNLCSSSEPATALAEPSGVGCKVTIVEIPATGPRYRRTFVHLQLKPPVYIPVGRWQRAIEDGRVFLAKWGEQAEALLWTVADLFGLHPPPERPHPSYNRLSRYDCTGLVWLLEGREVVALTDLSASIRNPKSGSFTVYRKRNKPAYGPLGDSLDDFA
jgi:hypothetical protein